MLQERIRISQHAKAAMDKRGYTNTDIIACIWSGEATEHQLFRGSYRTIVEGKDADKLPVVLVVGKDDKDAARLAIVTIFPPIKDKFKRVI